MKKENKGISQFPYMTIDCIFNKQNTWINLQNHEDPLKTMYDIWDKKLWYPLNYISNNKESKSHEEVAQIKKTFKKDYDFEIIEHFQYMNEQDGVIEGVELKNS